MSGSDPRNINASKGAYNMANTLLKAGAEAQLLVQRIVVQTTLETHAAVVEEITHNVMPHSGLSRKRHPEAVVTDLVDTGAYRASWTPVFPAPYQGEVNSNSKYGYWLEYGTKNGIPAFLVANITAIKMQKVFIERMKAGVAGLYK